MTVTNLTTGEPAWARQLPELLAAQGPAKPAAVAKRLRAAGHKVTTAEVEDELASRPDMHQTENGWLSLHALAEGSVLTSILTEQERRSGVLDAWNGLELWERLADDGIPLASGGELRLDWDEGFPGLTGPAGWLDGFEPGTAVGLRLHGGKAEVIATNVLRGVEDPEAFTEQIADRMAPLLRTCTNLCLAALDSFAAAAGESVSELELTMPGAPISDVVADLLAAEPGALSEPLPPIGMVLTVAGFEVRSGLVGLAGTFWNIDEAEPLEPEDIVASVLASAMLQTAGQGASSEQWCPPFWTRMSAGPDVVARVADTVERGGAMPEVLAELTRSAADPGQRAIATLLAARAAEADDDAEAGFRLVREAVSLDPALEPALADAGEYAAASGDYADADAFLRRAGRTSDDGLRRTLLQLLRPAAGGAGGASRNKPCPCGSGKKYKACCLASAPRSLRDRAVVRHASIEAYVERALSRDLVYAYAAAGGGTELWPLAVDLAAFDGALAVHYLESRGQWLPADERNLVERWLDTPLAVYEVTDVRPGSGVMVRPLPDGEPVWLADRSLSGSVRRLDLFLGRLLDCGEGPMLLAFPVRVDRGRRPSLLRLLSGDERDDRRDEASWDEAALDGAARRAYDPADIMAFFGPQPMPALQNREGHELVQCSAVYDVPAMSGCGRDAWSRLGAALGDDGDEEDRVTAHIELAGELLVRGWVQRDGARWTIECNSIERLRDLQLMVTAASPESRLVSESTIPMDKVLGEHMMTAGAEPGDPPGPGIPAPRSNPDAASAGAGPGDPAKFLDQYLRDSERRWVDESIPALGGRTPRQAAAQGGAAREELLALLDDFEWSERDTRGGGFSMSTAQLRELLGLQRTR